VSSGCAGCLLRDHLFRAVRRAFLAKRPTKELLELLSRWPGGSGGAEA
jgi:hypothetical protein